MLLRSRLKIALAAIGLLMSASAGAQDYPTKPVTLIVPWPAGGSTDISMRAIADSASKALGQPIVIDNKAGGGGTVGPATMAAAAKPDGYTIAQLPITVFRLPLMQEVSWDPAKDFSYIIHLTGYTFGVTTNAESPFKKWQDVVDYAKQNPGKLNYASGGIGSAAHIAMVALADRTGMNLTHVPYRGTAPAVTDLLGGRVQLTFTGAPKLLQHVEAGTMRALAVSGASRLKSAPNVPTVAESGFPGFEASQWYGILVPAGTPKAVVDRLNTEIRTAMAAPEIAERLSLEGAEVWTNTPTEFRDHISKEMARWGELVKRTGIKPE